AAPRPGPSHPGQLRNPQTPADPDLVCQASPLSSALHSHLRLLAELGGTLVCGVDHETDPARGASQRERVGARHRRVSRYPQCPSQTLYLDQKRRPDSGQHRPFCPTHRGYPSRTTYVTNHCYRTLAFFVIFVAHSKESTVS